ncbi:MAG: acyl-CoA reductase [Polyangiaceae bacterium]
MSESVDLREGAVRRLVDAGRRLHDRGATLAAALSESTGLSPEGVLFALGRSLEWDATRDDVTSFVEAAPPTSEVTVVLSANVFTASLRAIAWARAKAPRVTVRASRREPLFTELLLAECADPAITLVQDVVFETLRAGEVHVYGRDATLAAIRAQLSSDVTFVGHGSGMGVALVTKPEAMLVDAAKALADDVVLFDQRGCLSPRVVFVRRGFEGPFAEAFHRALDVRSTDVPRGRIEESEFASAIVWRQTMAAVGSVYEGTSHAIGVVDTVRPAIVPPPGRNVLVVPYDTLADVPGHLGPLRDLVVAVGGDHVQAVRDVFGTSVRASSLGQMQRPRLDGPVDVRGRVLR